MRRPFHRGLYDPNAETPALAGTRCGTCGAMAFPPMEIGCEVCGANDDALAEHPLAASGVVHSVATVHRHHGTDTEVPFTVAEIRLDGGPVVRATLVEVADTSAIGRRVDGRWVTVRTDDDGADVVELRFAVAER